MPVVKHLYVHVPFCRSRCAYCDFASEPIGPHSWAGRVEAYLARLRAELAGAAPLLGAPIETIYLGGGTPTVLPRDGLLALVYDLARWQGRSALRPALEFTVEANPGTIDAILLEELAAAGVTRLSIGVQSFSPRLRRVLGRRVSQADLEGCLSVIRSSGWSEWNIDLIHGIPGQTWDDAEADIERAIEAGPAHISLYDLTYTSSFQARVECTLGKDSVETARAFAEESYAQASAKVVAAGFERYEVSNFARPGHESRHNLAYWRGEDYVGIGAAAVSTVDGERFTNPRWVAEYLAGIPPEVEVIDERTRTWEKAMLGLRTSAGVDEDDVRDVLDRAAQKRLLRQGCLEWHCGKLRLNSGFLDLSNSVISALLVPPEGS